MGTWPVRRTLAGAAEARTVTRSLLASCVEPVDEEAVLLVVTELVSNAVQHGEDPIELRVAVTGGSVRIEVEDGGASRPKVGPSGAFAPSGRGLAIVAALGHWGCTPAGGNRKLVWCDVEAPGSPRTRPGPRRR
jgi:anti-sigma regulatory factor (Ser/Thr protein kinase)